MGRRVVVFFALACGPVVGVDSAGDGSHDGGATSASATADDASSGRGSSGSADGSSGERPAVCGDGIVDETEPCDDGNVDDGDGCDAQCRVPGTQLWETVLPRMSWCPRLAALDDGGVAVIGNEDFRPPARIPHIVVIDGGGGVRWAVQGGHWGFDWIKDIVAEAGGFVVVGEGDGLPDAYVRWMQRWTADGMMEAEAIFDTEEPIGMITDVEWRDDASYWIVARGDVDGEWTLFVRSFASSPTPATPLGSGAFEIMLARALDDGAYVASDDGVGTLTRVDHDGAVVWMLEYDAPVGWESYPSALASTASGDAIVTGLDQGDTHAQWIRRFDFAGSELWRTTVEVSAVSTDDYPRYVAVDATDASFVIGESQIEGGNQGFLVKYDADGVELWQTIWWGGEDGLNAKPCDVVVTSDGTVVVAGAAFLAGESPDTYWLRAFTP
jgi:cysteine-rich repeat protein